MNNKEQIKLAILTKSNKRRHNDDYGLCVAAIDESGEWIRLVADKEGDSLPTNTKLDVRQVLCVYGERAPLAYQIENFVLDDFYVINEDFNQYIRRLKQADEEGIFGNKANQVSKKDMTNIDGTLRLIEVKELAIYWEGLDPKCKACFIYDGTRYEGMAMTDPNNYTRKGSEAKKIGNAYIVVSLPDQPAYNKFVAAIFPQK